MCSMCLNCYFSSFAGPRFVLQLIKVFEGSFGGVTLYENPLYITPNAVSVYFISNYTVDQQYMYNIQVMCTCHPSEADETWHWPKCALHIG